MEAAMAESMVSVVVALMVIVLATVLLASRTHREHLRARFMHRIDGHRLWHRLHHRH
jgi:hypothetical protein